MNTLRVMAALACALVTAKCAAPYANAVLDNPDDAISGLPPPSETRPFPGIRQVAGQGATRIVWVHGICTHTDEWAQERFAVLAGELGLSGVTQLTDKKSSERTDTGHVVRYSGQLGTHSIDTRFLMWSALTRDAKYRLLSDNSDALGDHFTYERAKLNDELKKTLINDCFSDAVIYSGAAGGTIRAWMQDQVCDALGGDLTAPRSCLIRPGQKPTQTVFVTESIGSKLLYDAILAIASGPRGMNQAVAEQLASVQMVFMEANQIPLLDLAEPRFAVKAGRSALEPSIEASTTGRFSALLASARTTQRRNFASRYDDKVRIVAFTDPNDLLSYRLTRPQIPDSRVGVTNVILSNDVTYLGLVERPDVAHCGYNLNPQAAGLIVNGFSGGRVMPVSVPGPNKCGVTN